VLIDFVEGWYVMPLIAEVMQVANSHLLMVSTGSAWGWFY